MKVLLPKRDMLKYSYESTGEVTVDSIGKWLDDVLEGNIKPTLKS